MIGSIHIPLIEPDVGFSRIRLPEKDFMRSLTGDPLAALAGRPGQAGPLLLP